MANAIAAGRDMTADRSLRRTARQLGHGAMQLGRQIVVLGGKPDGGHGQAIAIYGDIGDNIAQARVACDQPSGADAHDGLERRP